MLIDLPRVSDDVILLFNKTMFCCTQYDSSWFVTKNTDKTHDKQTNA